MSWPIVDGSHTRGKRDGDGRPRLPSRSGLPQSVPAHQRTPFRAPNGLNELSLRSLSRFDLRKVECLQVLDGARTAEVEGILTDTEIARVVALSL